MRMHIISLSIYTTLILFSISAFCTNYAFAAVCKDSKTKFKVPGQKGTWNCKKLKNQKKYAYCYAEDNNIVRSNCKQFCGFCPCQDRNGKFKTKISGKPKKVKCSSKKFCDVEQYGEQFSKSCPKKCNTCDIEKQAECILQADFAHPYDDPNDAPYFGYSGAYLEVQKGKNEENLCDSAAPKPWCVYENSSKDGTYAYVQNIDDYYVTYEDQEGTKCEEYYDDDNIGCEYLYKETITMRGMLGVTTTFYGYHIYNDQDYYNYDPNWQDHMMAPALKITVLNTGAILDNGGNGWSHPVDVNITTHTGDNLDEVNTDHEGAFSLEVKCDGKCNCIAGAFETFHYDYYSKTGSPADRKSVV